MNLETKIDASVIVEKMNSFSFIKAGCEPMYYTLLESTLAALKANKKKRKEKLKTIAFYLGELSYVVCSELNLEPVGVDVVYDEEDQCVLYEEEIVISLKDVKTFYPLKGDDDLGWCYLTLMVLYFNLLAKYIVLRSQGEEQDTLEKDIIKAPTKNFFKLRGRKELDELIEIYGHALCSSAFPVMPNIGLSH